MYIYSCDCWNLKVFDKKRARKGRKIMGTLISNRPNESVIIISSKASRSRETAISL
jgi:hypothetical protein